MTGFPIPTLETAETVEQTDLLPIAQVNGGGNYSKARRVKVEDLMLSALFLQTGTGAVFRLVRDKLRETVSVKDFGAVGDGTTDDQAALEAAVAFCNTNGHDLYWPDGTYASDASIANFHDVRHFGPGVIERGAETFRVAPRNQDTQNLYVDAGAADDLADGLSASQPVQTLERASEIIKNYGPVACQWVVTLAAGSYGGAVFTRDFITGNGAGLLTIQGPTVSVATGFSCVFILLQQGASGSFQVAETITGGTSGATATVTAVTARRVVATIVSGTPVAGETITGGTSGATATLAHVEAEPTAIISQSADVTKTNGLTFGWLQQVDVKHIKTSAFTTSEMAGINASRFCDIRLTNVHDTGSYYACKFVNNCTYTFDRGVLVNNTFAGIHELFGVIRAVASGKVYCLSPTHAGIYSKEICTGHLDSFAVDAAGVTGVRFQAACYANTQGLTLRACPIGLTITGPSEIHEETGIVWGSGADACTRKYNLSPDVLLLFATGWTGDPSAYRSAPTPWLRFQDFTTSTYTDATNHQTTLATLEANEHATKGQSIKVVVRGKRNTGSNGTLTVKLTLATVTVSQAVLPTTATASATFEVEFEIICYADGDFQRCFVHSWQEGVLSDSQTQDRTETWVANDKILRVEVQQASALDSVTVNDIRMWA